MTRSSRSICTFAASAAVVALSACADAPLPAEPAPQMNRASAQAGFEPLHIAFADDQLCAAHGGFAVWTEITGSIKVAAVAKLGGGVRVVEIVTNGRITLAANGRTLQSALSGQAFYDIDADGNLLTITFVGLNGAFTVPGSGRIAIEAGRLVFDANGAVVHERGQHDVFGTAPAIAALCAYLAG